MSLKNLLWVSNREGGERSRRNGHGDYGGAFADVWFKDHLLLLYKTFFEAFGFVLISNEDLYHQNGMTLDEEAVGASGSKDRILTL